MNILCIRCTNKLEIMKTVGAVPAVLEYNLNWQWPDKNLPFSYPEFNKSGFNFIEKNEDPYIAFFTLKLFEKPLTQKLFEDDDLWKIIKRDFDNNKCKIIFYSPDFDATWLAKNLKLEKSKVKIISGEFTDNKDVYFCEFNGMSYYNILDGGVNYEKLFESMSRYYRDYHFLSLNHSVKKHRIELFNFINKNEEIRSKTKSNFFSRIITHFPQTEDEVRNKLSGLEIKLMDSDLIDDQDTIHFDKSRINPIIEYNSYVNLTTETGFEGNKIYLTEKLFRNFVTFKPFILIGQAKSLKRVKDWGFKTFGEWFDESYDEIKDENKRLDMIKKNILKLSKLSKKEIHILYYEMEEVLRHNYKHLKVHYKNQLKEFRNFLLKVEV